MFSGSRLKERRMALGYSQSAMADKLHINRSSYFNWEIGKTRPNQKNLRQLAAILDVSETYFESEYNIVNTYLKLSSENQNKVEGYAEELLQKQQSLKKIVPLFAVEVLSDVALSAGLGESFFDEFETETVYSEEEQYGYDIAAWIKGDSMEPVYLDGEVALIRASGFDYDGAVYALSWNDSVYIKKLYREENGFKMVSLNDDYPDKWIPYEDNPRIVGLVISHFIPVVGA
ncbi:XRE family transcriptional regulator [Streptococcus anginosus]|jgi:phage repressor protein C with HTH and peptisase S24 domain|uniref:XRE family transcriptional regulator n=3 Tax=Streptococcus anginosus TaxID=1328 RepID=A0A412PQ93_STRAP|nr:MULTISPECIES: XRE family transcriptional regulator [Streptococcus]EMG33440.1 Pleiotropic regulator of exopolysaccharide synthesis [Streptococcus oralis subsp. tigurinus AZ_3a]KAA9248232.1 helix-turn-helix transcriptional regulator [Streptococcus anginosus]KAA9269646.1 helix-turn-helix transcriptional regulator [Streptococcus anginosus]MCW0928369.1 XRE family transcriptional regulator [Streptococcus anginosus]MCW0986937.1 XRE family transcriptional regulator [Streptococcus anginosus]